MRNHMAAAAFTCLLAICGTVGAKTVALWPLDSARCAIDPRNDLTVNKASFEAQTIGWNLPPNADSNVTASARYLFDPVSRSCLRSAGNDQYFYCASSAVLEKALDPTAGSDFTVEGYFKWSALSDEQSQRRMDAQLLQQVHAVRGGGRKDGRVLPPRRQWLERRFQ